MRYSHSFLIFIAFILFPFFTYGQQLLKGKFWKKQALEDVMPAWQRAVFNENSGGFHTYLKRDWTPYKNDRQYPGMIARQLFSFSAAYLMSGEQKHLKHAHKTFNYLVTHGWDEKHGGWYESISGNGKAVNKAKDLFMQTYAITGLALYHAVTRDSTAKAYLDTTYQILREHAWDEKHQGYYDKLTRNLSVASNKKDFSPQLAPASGFLTYLYPTTRKNEYLKHFETIVNMGWNKMRHPQRPWIMESFTRDWQLIDGQNKAMNVGHNLEVVWLMLRLHHLTDKMAYKRKALELTNPLNTQAFDHRSGAWHHKIPIDNPKLKDSTASWWVQAYGNMTQLYLYRVTGRNHFLEKFRKGAEFWNNAFLDETYGGNILKVKLDGTIIKGAKGVRTKTAYHAIEHGLLNYLYLNLWVQEKPVELHYHLEKTKEGQEFYPNLLADPSVIIKKVELNGSEWKAFQPEKGLITLPAKAAVSLKVTFKAKE